MNRKYSLITFVTVLMLLVAQGAAAQMYPPVQMASGAARVPQADPVSTEQANAANAAYAHFFLQDPLTSNPWQRSHTIVDGSGGVHVTFYDNDSIYYAHCAMNCSDPANWLELPLFAAGIYDSLDDPTLGVDASGRPRLMWYAEYSGETNARYYYAECNANCTDSAANWTSRAIAELGSYDYPHNVRYAALDTQGRPRLIYEMSNYPDYGFNYLACDANCTIASNWQTTAVTTPDLEPDMNLQLVFDSNDRPRVLGYDDTNHVLVYAECNNSCSTAANWGSVALFEVGYYFDYDFALRLDAQGRPRIAYYSKDSSDNVLMYYAWSNTNSLTAAGWYSYSLNYPTNDELSLDLALDGQGRPSVMYATDKLDLGYLTCTANCETASPTWQQQLIETGEELDASYPIAQIPTCTPPVWMVFGYPSLALDAAGNPNVSYLVRHGQFCPDSQGHLQIYYNARSIRFATVGGSSTPTAPSSVIPTGPALGIINVSYTFTATVTPITATTPITYVWQVTGLPTQTHTGRGGSDTATFTWPSGATGLKTITVSASNRVGIAHGSKNIIISETPIIFNHWGYLPAVLR
jgi:hypothetical protein